MAVEFDLEVLSRLPLADAAFSILRHVSDDEFLNGVFERHRRRSYDRVISFPVLVRLISDALLGRSGAHQVFRRARDAGQVDASVQAVYRKLSRLPTSLSLGFFGEAAQRLEELAPAAAAHPAPPSLSEFRMCAFDGKKLKQVAQRLKPLRGLKGKFFGGKLLVVQDMVNQRAIAAEAAIDGESADNPLVPDVVARVRALPDERPRLWFADRAFCEFKTLNLLAQGSSHFVVRFNSSCRFHPDSSVKAAEGTDDEGRPCRDEVGWLGAEGHPLRIRVRKITVARSNDEFAVVTSLIDADRRPAAELLSAYRRRWGIETMFQQVVQTFDLRHLIGSTPEATVFQAMLCTLLYNITLVIRDHAAAGADKKPADISTKLFFDDLTDELTALVKVTGCQTLLDVFEEVQVMTAAELRRRLQTILKDVWTRLWEKSPTRKRPPKGSPRAYVCGGHTSVDKVLRGAHREIPFKEKRDRSADPPPFETKKDV